jgi:lysophospholipase L1-like esterase
MRFRGSGTRLGQWVSVWAMVLMASLARTGWATTTTFSLADAHVAQTGAFPVIATTFLQFVGPNAQVDFIATGTGLTLQYQSGSGAGNEFKIIVDGSSSTPATTGDNTVRTLTVFSALTDADHRVTIKWVGAGPTYAANFASTLSLTGGAPGLKTPNTAFTGQIDLSGTMVPLNGQAGIDTNPGMAATSFLANQYVSSWPDAALRFRASPAGAWKIQAYTGQTSRRYKVSVDGSFQAAIAQGSSGFWEWQALASGTGDGLEHEFAIWFIDATPSTVAYLYSVNLSGMSINAAYAWPARDGWAWYGDSIETGEVISPVDSTTSFAYRVCTQRNAIDANRSIGGTTVNASGQVRTADITGLSPAPKRCVVLYGSNDAATSVSVPTFQTAFQSMMHSLCSGLPLCHFTVLLILPRSGVTTSTYNSAIQSAIGALTGGEQAQITIVDTGPWNFAPGGTDFTTNYNGDGIHPNATGNTLIANELLSFLATNYQRRVPGGRIGNRTIAGIRYSGIRCSGIRENPVGYPHPNTSTPNTKHQTPLPGGSLCTTH